MAHSARTINRFHIGPDGKTSYRRWKGKDFRGEITEFGESVLYLKAGSKGQDKYNQRWEAGVWLGIRDETGESISGTNVRAIKARDVKRKGSQDERWNLQAVLAVQGTPWEPIPGQRKDAIPVRVRLSEEGESQPEPVNLGEEDEPTKRRARISRQDVIRFGYTVNCPGCQAISRNAPAQNHTEECRKRIEAELIKEGGAKAEKVNAGQERYVKHQARNRP